MNKKKVLAGAPAFAMTFGTVTSFGKALIGLLSVGFRRNKKGLDSSVFTFRENH